jgi:hypothetical protein
MLAASTADRHRRLLRAVTLAVACLIALGVAPTATSAASKSYVIDLGRRSDFVAQSNFVQCVGASMQMMLNMMRSGADRSASTQRELQVLARAWSGPRRPGRERQGASVRGWSTGLNLLGAGPYRVDGADTIDAALLVAARAIRTTGRPVGLLMWRGRHAWVMSGFRATRDPLVPGARVTAVIVEDPLHPYGSSVWGPSPAPGAELSVKTLGRQFVPRRRSAQASSLGGKYVFVMPYEFSARVLRTK